MRRPVATVRAKLRELKRDAAVVLGDVGTADDVAMLTRALADPEPLVGEHATWALERLAGRRRGATTAAPTIGHGAPRGNVPTAGS